MGGRGDARREAWVVVDLGFGDAGKGTVVDFLARERGAHTVVRFNGGAQAAHNVVTDDGRHHTFAQFGAATFVPGVRTHLSRHVVVHPTALLVEARALARAGVPDALARLTVHRDALVITPFQQAACRLRELARGAGRHGSCGVGVGEAVSDALSGGPADAVRVGDLAGDLRALRARLARVQARKRAELADAARALRGVPEAQGELRVLEAADATEAWLDALAPLRAAPGLVVGDEALAAALAADGAVLFEGAQGVLLDEWRGFHPYTTWSTCTFDNALALLREHRFGGGVTRLGVVRAYATRHGPGPFPTEDAGVTAAVPEAHNGAGRWQGAFRAGWLDAPLLRYALAACRADGRHARGADALAVTHLDRLGALPEWRGAVGYRLRQGAAEAPWFATDPADARRVTGVRLGPTQDLGYQEALGRALAAAEPVLQRLDAGAEGEGLLRWLEAELGVGVALGSYGPRAADKRWRRTTPLLASSRAWPRAPEVSP